MDTADAPELEAQARRSGLPLGRIFGIRIQADPSWFLIFFLVLLSLSAGHFPHVAPGESPLTYWFVGLLTTLLFFASILLHELAHALAAQRAGMEVPRITLFLFGGVSELRKEPRSPALEFKIAALGPVASFALAGVAWLVWRLAPAEPWYLAAVARYLAWINLAVGLFNLLPGYPLDGGRMLRAWLWRRWGSLKRATRAASGAGRAFGLALAILGGLEILLGGLVGGIWLILIGLFLRSMAGRSYRALVLQHLLEDGTVADVMTPAERMIAVGPDLSLRAAADEYFLKHGFRGFPVVEDGRVLGLITLEALRARERERWDDVYVRDVMLPVSERTTTQASAPLSEAVEKLAASPAGRLLAMRGDELAGGITSRDIARFLDVRSLLEEPPTAGGADVLRGDRGSPQAAH
jgi:Zn-dependent protease/CBS domain-containing protein